MLTFDEARARVLADATRLGEERVALGEADGRVLAEALVADRPLPPFDGSAMDGYALRLDVSPANRRSGSRSARSRVAPAGRRPRSGRAPPAGSSPARRSPPGPTPS